MKDDILDDALIACASGCDQVLSLIEREDGKGVEFLIYVWPEGEPSEGRLLTPDTMSNNTVRAILRFAIEKVGEDVRRTGETRQ